MTDPDELLRLLNIDADEKLLAGRSAKKLFALRVPRSFIDRMEKGNPDDPLLRQVLTSQDEFVVAPGFSTDPLEEQHSVCLLYTSFRCVTWNSFSITQPVYQVPVS